MYQKERWDIMIDIYSGKTTNIRYISTYLGGRTNMHRTVALLKYSTQAIRLCSMWSPCDQTKTVYRHAILAQVNVPHSRKYLCLEYTTFIQQNSHERSTYSQLQVSCNDTCSVGNHSGATDVSDNHSGATDVSDS